MGLAKCSLARSANLRLRDQVHAVDTGAQETSALMLEPFRPFIVTADGEGTLRVADYMNSLLINQFSIEVLYPFTSSLPRIDSLYHLNDLYNDLLMVCGTDGIVSIWRDYTKKGSQNLATVWRTVLNPAVASRSLPVNYCYSSEFLSGVLFAAGGRDGQKRTAINMWDLEHESCALQMRPPDKIFVDYLACAKRSPLVFAANRDGTVLMFDVRANHPVGELKSTQSTLIGIVSEPGGIDNHLVAGYRDGNISFIDIRKSGSDGAITGAIWKRVEAHSKGNMTNICGHTYAPILASATASQVVKVWSANGDQIGVVRTKPGMLSSGPLGATSCLDFANYGLELASGGRDNVCAIYHLEVSS